jgi:DNA-binding transcriptional ArsR family regulator
MLSEDQAADLAALFKTFSNGTRLRLLHALVQAGELCVTDLARAAAMKPQAVSNQLQRLVDRGILASRRGGNNVLYRIVDPCVRVLLERGLCLLECPTEGDNAALAQARVARGSVGSEHHSERVGRSIVAGLER